MSSPAIATPRSEQEFTAAATPSTQDITNLAYALWQQRGSPYGTSDQDWLEAERQLRDSATGNLNETALVNGAR